MFDSGVLVGVICRLKKYCEYNGVRADQFDKMLMFNPLDSDAIIACGEVGELFKYFSEKEKSDNRFWFTLLYLTFHKRRKGEKLRDYFLRILGEITFNLWRKTELKGEIILVKEIVIDFINKLYGSGKIAKLISIGSGECSFAEATSLAIILSAYDIQKIAWTRVLEEIRAIDVKSVDSWDCLQAQFLDKR